MVCLIYPDEADPERAAVIDKLNDAPDVAEFFTGRPVGSWLQLQISRDLTVSDVRHVPTTYKGGTRQEAHDLLVIPVNTLQTSASGGALPGYVIVGTLALSMTGGPMFALMGAMCIAGLNDDVARGLGDGAIFVTPLAQCARVGSSERQALAHR